MRKYRQCSLCLADIPEGEGVYHSQVGRLFHQGDCIQAVAALERDYSHSQRGRYRQGWEMRKMIRQQAQGAK